jgi:hypothetical protein
MEPSQPESLVLGTATRATSAARSPTTAAGSPPSASPLPVPPPGTRAWQHRRLPLSRYWLVKLLWPNGWAVQQQSAATRPTYTRPFSTRITPLTRLNDLHRPPCGCFASRKVRDSSPLAPPHRGPEGQAGESPKCSNQADLRLALTDPAQGPLGLGTELRHAARN